MPEHVDRRRRPPVAEQPDREQSGVVHDVAEYGHAVLGRRPDGRCGSAGAVVRFAAALGQVAVVVDVPSGQLRRQTRKVVGQPDHQGVRRLRVRLRVFGPRPDRQQQQQRRPTSHGVPATEERQGRTETSRRRQSSSPPSPSPSTPATASQPSQSTASPSPSSQRRWPDPSPDQVHGGAPVVTSTVSDRGHRVVGQLRVLGRVFVVVVVGGRRRRWRLLRGLHQERQGQSDGLPEIRGTASATAAAGRGDEALMRISMIAYYF